MKQLLLLLALFHHDRQKQAVRQFAQLEARHLSTYQKDNPEEWIEAEQIEWIAEQIHFITQKPHCKDIVQREHAISDALGDLHDYDQQLQKQGADLQAEAEPI